MQEETCYTCFELLVLLLPSNIVVIFWKIKGIEEEEEEKKKKENET